jgi:hypothetical protein
MNRAGLPSAPGVASDPYCPRHVAPAVRALPFDLHNRLGGANIGQFCGISGAMVRITETRFLVITRYAAQIARIDRLYGLTSAETGVS